MSAVYVVMESNTDDIIGIFSNTYVLKEATDRLDDANFEYKVLAAAIDNFMFIEEIEVLAANS